MSEKNTRFVREIVEIIAFTLLIFSVIHFAVQGFRTSGESMQPNFHNNEYVLVNKVEYLFQQPQRGDVIVFHYPLIRARTSSSASLACQAIPCKRDLPV